MKHGKSLLFKKRFEALILAFSLVSFVNATAYSAQLSASQLKAANEDLIELKEKTEALLRKKGFIISKDLSGELKGELSGSLTGSYSETSRFSSALGLSVLGLFAGFVSGGLAVPGLVAGGLAGVALPEEVASGNIRGNLKGKIEGKQWDNVSDGSLWGVVVIEPSQIERIKKFNEKYMSNNSECTTGYIKIISDIIRSKKYFTRTEVNEMIQHISQIRSLVTSIGFSLRSYKEKNELQNYIKPFFSKKILFSSIGVDFDQADQVGIVTDLSYDVDFVGLKYKEKNEVDFKSLPKIQIDEQPTSEALAQKALDKLKRFAFKKDVIFQVKQYQKENLFETDNLGYITSRNGVFIFTNDHLFSSEKSKDYYFQVKYDKVLRTNLVLQNDSAVGFDNHFICKSKDDLIQFLNKSAHGKEMLFNEVSSD